MKFSQAQSGRVFVLRLEDGEIVHECLERFAAEHGIARAVLTLHGGADVGSVLVTGPREDRCPPPIAPQTTTLDHVHEVVGTRHDFPRRKGCAHPARASGLRPRRKNRHGLHPHGGEGLARARGRPDRAGRLDRPAGARCRHRLRAACALNRRIPDRRGGAPGIMVRRAGLEPATTSLKGSCSTD